MDFLKNFDLSKLGMDGPIEIASTPPGGAVGSSAGDGMSGVGRFLGRAGNVAHNLDQNKGWQKATGQGLPPGLEALLAGGGMGGGGIAEILKLLKSQGSQSTPVAQQQVSPMMGQRPKPVSTTSLPRKAQQPQIMAGMNQMR